MVDKAGLIDLWEDIREAREFKHLQTEGIRLVPGIGADEPWAFVVGEAPGAEENRVGEPFVGLSGKVLQQLMSLAGMYARPVAVRGSDRHPETSGEVQPNVWLTNTVKFRPPGNRTPTIGEILAAQPFLRREWALVGRPRLIVAVGSVARQALSPVHFSPPRAELILMRDNRTYFTTMYHPAYGLRGDQARKDMIERHWEHLAERIEEMRDELQAFE